MSVVDDKAQQVNCLRKITSKIKFELKKTSKKQKTTTDTKSLLFRLSWSFLHANE